MGSYLVAHELHANGDDHLHVYLKSETAFDTVSPQYFDLYWDDNVYHGNYQGCRSAKNVLRYCSKGDDYVSNMDVAALVDRKAKRSIIAAKVVRDKVPLHNLLDEFPEMVYDYKRIK